MRSFRNRFKYSWALKNVGNSYNNSNGYSAEHEIKVHIVLEDLVVPSKQNYITLFKEKDKNK